MTDEHNLVHIADLEHLRDLCDRYARMGDQYVYCHFATSGHTTSDTGRGRRFSGITLMIVDRGQLEGEIDDRPFVMGPGSIMVVGRWNSLVLAHRKPKEIEGHLLFVSSQFLQDVDIDLNAVNMHGLLDDRANPVADNLPENELGLLRDALSGLYRVAREEAQGVYTRNMSRSLVQLLIYTLLQIRETRTASARRDGIPSRQVTYAQEFMRLLGIHHTHSRDVGFYADKLHISPKYLSHLVKQHTGKSAGEWIGEYVAREAKNMLRYSNKNVQQVAYALNFSTQSAFGKFFKHVTGMSPTEYQKS